MRGDLPNDIKLLRAWASSMMRFAAINAEMNPALRGHGEPFEVYVLCSDPFDAKEVSNVARRGSL